MANTIVDNADQLQHYWNQVDERIRNKMSNGDGYTRQYPYITGNHVSIESGRKNATTLMPFNTFNNLKADQADTMTAPEKALKLTLKKIFDTDFVVQNFDPRGYVSLVWRPDQGTTEYGTFDIDDPLKTRITVYNNQSGSMAAWSAIFNAVRYFFNEQKSALYLMANDDWDGEFHILFERYPQIRVQFDEFAEQWNAKILNEDTYGPPVFDFYDPDIIEAVSGVLTDAVLYPTWDNKEKGSLEEFRDWKVYKLDEQ